MSKTRIKIKPLYLSPLNDKQGGDIPVPTPSNKNEPQGKSGHCPVCGANHHALCHRCPHAAEVDAGAYTDREFARTPCSSCKPIEDDRQRHVRGQEVVSIEELHSALDDSSPECSATRLMSMLSFLLGQILACGSAPTRESVMRRLYGDSLDSIAGAVSVAFGGTYTAQAIHARIKEAEAGNKTIAMLLQAQKNQERKGD